MSRSLSFISIIACLLSGCVSVVDAVTSKPIVTDHGERTVGSVIDDGNIETITAVNLRKSDPALRASHITVISFNGVVLLVGQVPTPENRDAAADIAHRVQNVRQVHNELTIGANISIWARLHDSWLTGKIKTRLAFSSNADAGRVKVITENGVVYLMGLLTRAESDAAVEVARHSSGIQKIVRVFEYID